MPERARSRTTTTDLREACVSAAREAIAAHGVEQLSLRDVARRLGVSHQAPYRHYPSRDHLLAEVMRRCFATFAAQLEARARHADPRRELAALGRQYLDFALSHPLEYRLMFGTPWPDAAHHPALVQEGTRAFDILRAVLLRVHGPRAQARAVDLDAIFIWSAMHGLAGVLGSDWPDRIGLAPTVRRQMRAHALQRLEAAMAAAGPQGPAAAPLRPPARSVAAPRAPAGPPRAPRCPGRPR